MSYVVVEDVAASWERYRRVADALAGPPPSGLIVHAANPGAGVRVGELYSMPYAGAVRPG